MFAIRFLGGDLSSQVGFTAGGVEDDEGLGISIDPVSLNVYLSGYFQNTVQFPGISGTTTSNGMKDGYLGLANAGFSGFNWISTAGNSLDPNINDQFNTVDVDHCGYIYHGHLLGGDPNIMQTFLWGPNMGGAPPLDYYSKVYKYENGTGGQHLFGVMLLPYHLLIVLLMAVWTSPQHHTRYMVQMYIM